jgi:hypothetical protein
VKGCADKAHDKANPNRYLKARPSALERMRVIVTPPLNAVAFICP